MATILSAILGGIGFLVYAIVYVFLFVPLLGWSSQDACGVIAVFPISLVLGGLLGGITGGTIDLRDAGYRIASLVIAIGAGCAFVVAGLFLIRYFGLGWKGLVTPFFGLPILWGIWSICRAVDAIRKGTPR